MKKKQVLILTSIVSIATTIAAIEMISKNTGLSVSANENTLYYHYEAVEATQTRHGSKEFWMNCDTNEPTLIKPSGNIQEGTNFDSLDGFYNLEKTDSRYIDPFCAHPVYNPINFTVTYGLYPQVLLEDEELCTILETNKDSLIKSNGWYKYHGEYYARSLGQLNPSVGPQKFDNGESIKTNAIYWFKCEPIVWKVIHEQDDVYLLLSSILLDTQKYCPIDYDRTIDDTTIYPNNYKFSGVRAWLNGYNGTSYSIANYSNTGFINTAFTFGSSSIVTTEIDNSQASTYMNGTLPNPYVCENTFDKLFLLSYQDYLREDYGFSSYNGGSLTRVFRTTDYARSNGAYTCDPNDDNTPCAGMYFTRSPFYSKSTDVNFVNYGGSIAGYAFYEWVYRPYFSVCPALQIVLG